MLLNVKLGPEEERIVRGLKRRKVNVSALVRRELAAAGAALLGVPAKSPARIVAQILKEIPATPRRRGSRPALDDRAAVRAHIKKKLQRR